MKKISYIFDKLNFYIYKYIHILFLSISVILSKLHCHMIQNCTNTACTLLGRYVKKIQHYIRGRCCSAMKKAHKCA